MTVSVNYRKIKEDKESFIKKDFLQCRHEKMFSSMDSCKVEQKKYIWKYWIFVLNTD